MWLSPCCYPLTKQLSHPVSWALTPAAAWGSLPPCKPCLVPSRTSRGEPAIPVGGQGERGHRRRGRDKSLSFSSNQGFLVPHSPPWDNLCQSESPKEKKEEIMAGLNVRGNMKTYKGHGHICSSLDHPGACLRDKKA